MPLISRDLAPVDPPTISNLPAGAVVPIPTLPPDRTTNLLDPPVCKSSNLLVPVPTDVSVTLSWKAVY